MRFCSSAIGILVLLPCSTGCSIAATTYQYDDLGRLKIASYDNGKEIDYNYDPAGNRSSVVIQTTPHMAPHKIPAHSTKKTKAGH
jgi:hypothetical protein